VRVKERKVVAMKILVLGASGMIGSAIFRVLSNESHYEVYGSIRSKELKKFFKDDLNKRLVICSDILDQIQLVRLFSEIKPNVVINCIGLTKHHKEAGDVLLAVSLNTTLPHRLADLCKASSARLIHISTDCVFSGLRGNYLEEDDSDATDVYGKSKYLGEVVNKSHTITLRTSTIGHELHSSYGLLEWFLAQEGSCTGFNKAFFSGLPNTVFAEIIRDYIIPNPELYGLYHVGAAPISKYELLKLIAIQYNKSIAIIFDEKCAIDRSLNTSLFSHITGYHAPSWPQLIKSMYKSQEVLNVSR
jgi:dTDP-4-dehydrorhamnose reductase